MDIQVELMRFVFIANVIVAGVVGSLSLFRPKLAASSVFSGVAEPSIPMQIVGAFWSTIAIISLLAIFNPLGFGIVLLIQLLYKGMWLLFVALPAGLAGRFEKIPGGITIFFIMWVIVLPFLIPWKHLFNFG